MCQSDNSEARLRAMGDADVGALVNLWVEAWRATMPAIDFEARRGWIDAFLLDPAHKTLVAGATSLLGFVSVEDDYLHQLVVAPSMQGSGLATHLLDAVKAEARAGLRLDVNQANARAIRFYAREGFVTIAVGRNLTSDLATWAMHWRCP